MQSSLAEATRPPGSQVTAQIVSVCPLNSHVRRMLTGGPDDAAAAKSSAAAAVAVRAAVVVAAMVAGRRSGATGDGGADAESGRPAGEGGGVM